MRVVKIAVENGSLVRIGMEDVTEIVIECAGRYLTTLYLRDDEIWAPQDPFREISLGPKGVVTINDKILHRGEEV